MTRRLGLCQSVQGYDSGSVVEAIQAGPGDHTLTIMAYPQKPWEMTFSSKEVSAAFELVSGSSPIPEMFCTWQVGKKAKPKSLPYPRAGPLARPKEQKSLPATRPKAAERKTSRQDMGSKRS